MRLLLLSLTLLFGGVVLAGDRSDDPAFVWAIIRKESSGRSHAVGDKNHPTGCAVGKFQVRPPVLQDVNQAFHTSLTHKDMEDDVKAYWVFRAYLQLWATKARLGHEPTHEDMARIWNGGPSGYRKDTTVKYWRIVKGYIAENRKKGRK